MTVTAFPSRNEFTAVNGQTVFNYTFLIFKNTDLTVYVTPAGQVSDDAADERSDFTVDPGTIGNPDGGFITFNGGLAINELVTIVSSIPEDRTTDYQNSGDFRPDTVNADFDRTVALVKQQDDRSSRVLAFEESQQNAAGLTLPNPDAGLYLRWKNDESGVENAGVPAVIVAQKEFATINDLKNAVAGTADGEISINDFVIIQDYATGRNTGVLFFKIVAGATGTDDGGTFIDLTVSGFQAQQNFPNFRMPKMFGAVGNGTKLGGGADDTTALNNTYAAATAADVPMHLGRGAFRFISQLLWNGEIDVIGLGRGDTAPTNGSTLIKDGNFVGIRVDTSTGHLLHNFALIGATGNADGGLEIFRGERLTAGQLLIQDMGGYNLVMRGGNLQQWNDIMLINAGTNGLIWHGGSGPVGVSVNACFATNIDIRGSTDDAVDWIEGGQNVFQATIQNNDGKGFDINGAASKSNLFTLYFESNGLLATIGTAVIGNYFTIVLGTITDNSATGTNMVLEHNQAGTDRYSFINLFANAIRIEDRETNGGDASAWQWSEAGTSSLHKLILDSLGSGANPGLIEIKQSLGNVIDMTLAGEFRPKGVVSTSVVTMTSGDTTPSIDGINTLLTAGTTPITNFDDAVIGQVIDIKAKASIIVRNNAQVQLAGSVDYNMTVGDILSLKLFESGVFTEMGRTVV